MIQASGSLWFLSQYHNEYVYVNKHVQLFPLSVKKKQVLYDSIRFRDISLKCHNNCVICKYIHYMLITPHAMTLLRFEHILTFLNLILSVLELLFYAKTLRLIFAINGKLKS